MLRFFNGDYFEGRWAAGVREGLGMQQCTDDSNYVGEYARGKRHGVGVYSFPTGDTYSGSYEEDLPQVGTAGAAGQVACRGRPPPSEQHVASRMAACTTAARHTRAGRRLATRPQGYGVYVFASGQKYEGHWQSGKKHGWSIYTVETGGQGGMQTCPGGPGR